MECHENWFKELAKLFERFSRFVYLFATRIGKIWQSVSMPWKFRTICACITIWYSLNNFYLVECTVVVSNWHTVGFIEFWVALWGIYHRSSRPTFVQLDENHKWPMEQWSRKFLGPYSVVYMIQSVNKNIVAKNTQSNPAASRLHGTWRKRK